MQEPIDVTDRMRKEWNERAREDAHFYVAFGRREQNDDEFFETAREVVSGLEWELRRFPARENRRAWRALEIGCGPGRLIKPMSRHFGEIHGVDVSDEMILRARQNLRGIAHAHVHATSGADLAQFADESFHLVYSYAVFQHIPSRDVVMQYLRETQRVLRPGGLLRCQINGLDKTAKTYDTWSGVRIDADEVREYALENDMQLLALEGVRTQYMWTTMRKRSKGWRLPQSTGPARIRRVTNAHNSEPVVPLCGRFASFTMWIESLPSDCDLIGLSVFVGGVAVNPCYIGPPEADGLQQVNVLMRDIGRTGILPLDVFCNDSKICETVGLRVIPPGPLVPHILSITDGINMMSGTRVSSGSVKVTIEEAEDLSDFRAEIDGKTVSGIDIFCADPLPPRYEINFDLPAGVAPGNHSLEISLGRRVLGRDNLEIVGA
ncbi:MAG TPA: class I SAM-dependent methyltransferase [Bryobacteraceae bacterium]|nr:class I SAM-dependent methyltransferase [Bryobacteraceae bacterium]